MALSWPVTVLVTAVLAVLCSMCIYTEYEYTISVPVKATADDAFKFFSNPIAMKDVYVKIVSMEISSQRPIQDPPGQYYELDVVENMPGFGKHTFHAHVWYDLEARSIFNMADLFWGIMSFNVTWTVVSDGDTGTCYIEEHGVTRLPWILSSHVKSIQIEQHYDILYRAQSLIEKDTNRHPQGEPASPQQHEHL